MQRLALLFQGFCLLLGGLYDLTQAACTLEQLTMILAAGALKLGA